MTVHIRPQEPYSKEQVENIFKAIGARAAYTKPGKWRVYRHEKRKTRWVVDPPGFDSRGAAGHGIRDPRKAVKQARKRDNAWYQAGGRIIDGYAPAKQYALEQSLITRWLDMGREAKEII